MPRHQLIRTRSLAVLICFFISTWTLSLFAAPGVQDERPVLLEQSRVWETALKGGETHEYQIALLAGQFLYLLVEQKGVDVAVTLYTPEGRKVSKVDSLNAEYGPEPVVAMAATSGLYRVVVVACSKDSPPGRYEIRIAEQRTPMPGDAEHIAAERNIEAAFALESTGDGRDWDAAIVKLQEALPYFETAGSKDAYRHGLLLFSIGYSLAQKTRIRESIAAYLEALPLFQSAGDSMMEAKTRNNLGGEYHDLGEPSTAMQYHKEALSMFPPGQAVKQRTAALNNLGVLYEEMGDWSAALDAYDRAASDFGASGNWREEAIAWRNVAYVYRTMSEPEQALRYLDQARELMLLKSVKDPSVQAEILTNRAEVLLSQEKFAQALDSCEQALKLRQIAGDSRREGDTLSVLGSVYQALQQTEKAERAFQEALEKQQAAGYQFGAFRTLLRMGNFHLPQKTGQAKAELEQAAKIADSLGCGECKAQAGLSLGRLQRALGDFSESLRQTRNTVETLEKLQAGLGASVLRASFLGGHEQAYEFYIDLSLHDPSQLSPETDAAQAFQISERARARSFLEIMSGMRTDLLHQDGELAKKEQAVHDELAWNAGKLLKLWQDSPARSRGNLRKPSDIEERIEQLEAEYNLIEAEKARKNKGYATLTQPDFLTASQVQKGLLDDQTVFLEYYLGDEKSYLWAITQDAIAAYQLPPRKQIETASRNLYELLQKHTPVNNTLISAASGLSNLILGPVREKLGTRRLVIAADGALQYIPFAALSEPGVTDHYQPLMLAHEIVNVPSASAIAAQHKSLAHRTPAERSLAVFADPVFSTQDPRLASRPAVQSASLSFGPGARLLEHVQSGASARPISRLPFTAIEANKISAMVPPGSSMKAMGFDASRDLAMNPDLGHYKYLHFATHGYIDSRHPELSALVLSLVDKGGNVQNGFLRLQDIYNLHLHADLVVLSACETGLGKEIRGEGMIGLTRGFMYAGAARVLVSLWDVSDQGTSELMPLFYKGLLVQGKSAPAALREAQIAMFKSTQWRDPYYWAPFTLQGDWK